MNTRLLFALALAAITSIAAIGALSRAPTTSAALDLTGEWTYTIDGDYEGTCAVTLTQTGDNITGDFDCPGGAEDGVLDGTVTLRGATHVLEGTVTLYVGSVAVEVWDISTEIFLAGNTVSGAWQASSGDSGTMLGRRNVPIYIKGDINCDGEVTGADVLSGILWSLEFDPLQQSDCPAIGEDLGIIFADIDCSGAPDFSDALPLLRYAAGLSVTLPTECLPIGDTYSPIIPT